MDEGVVVQGRRVTGEDVAWIRGLMSANPEWSRWRLSQELAGEWDWRNARGQLKDMAARTLLVKLEGRGVIQLPPRRQTPSNRMALPVRVESWDRTPLEGSLRELGPLTVNEVSGDQPERARLAAALEEFHYLGFRGPVGENLQYMVTGQNHLLACLVFGAAAWKCRARDEHIGWTAEQRAERLHLIANNSRFLILPFVKAPHLASWILGRVLGRLSRDWERKYGHGILLAETFVERVRFRGTSYKAANWRCVGSTAGRSRQDRYSTLRVPVKDVYVYPLRKSFGRELCS